MLPQDFQQVRRRRDGFPRDDLGAAAVDEFAVADRLARAVADDADDGDMALEMRGRAGTGPPVGDLAVDGMHLVQRELAAVGPLRAGPQLVKLATLLAHEAPGRFDIEEECELKATDDSQAIVRYSKHSLNNAEVRKHIQNGKLPTRLALTWNGRVSFVLNDKWQVKRVRFLDGVFPESDPADTGADAGENAADRFEADWTITTGELAQLVPELIEALGGAMAVAA